MKTSTIGLVSACVGSLALAACATATTAATTDKKANVVYKVADAETEARIPAGYTLIRKGGVEYFCHTEAATGSRTQKKETCQTREQIDAERNGTKNTADYAQGR